ncbi:MAG: AmmeMemoRadiSam system protein [Candidatus Parcubacteria bacterium]|jgi:poly-gamma-glutamate synthesis protein (capsule biosynthesis protein)
MVPVATWKKIGLGVALVGVLFGMYAHRQNIPGALYLATNPELDLAVVDGITKADKANNQSGSIKRNRAVIVPHHLVASEAIAIGIKALVVSHPKTIILISPDHFGKCPKMLCTTDGQFKTFFGAVSVAQDKVSQLVRHTAVVAESNLFVGEHGIYSIVPFIKHYLPDATIVPIAVSQRGIGDSATRAEMLTILDELMIQPDTVIVVSSDFSHYLPLAEAIEYDRSTQDALCSGADKEILALNNPRQSDCPLCLWLLEQKAKRAGFWNPSLLWHSNSANLMHDTSAQSTTSHFTLALSDTPSVGGVCPITEKKKSVMSVLFVGDMSFDRYIRQVITKKGADFIFSCIQSLLSAVDLVVGNLEGPITDNDSVSAGSVFGSPENYVFTFPTTTASTLFRHHIELVNIGNNHIANFGREGLLSTQSYLSRARVGYFGGLSGDESVYRTGQFSFISYNAFGGQSAEKVAQIIEQEKQAGRWVVVYAHWGNEYADVSDTVKKNAKLFAQSGADLVIGSHPHVVQSHEYIGKTLVYYSLGNFIFDQYFNSSVTNGLAVKVTFSDAGLVSSEIPLILNQDGRTCVK